MKITQLLSDLKTVTDDFPEAEYELGYCSCCIYIWIEGRRIAKYDTSSEEFVYLDPGPVPDANTRAAVMTYLERKRT
jgi:hypothetical protein